jgi:hypothetical protein
MHYRYCWKEADGRVAFRTPLYGRYTPVLSIALIFPLGFESSSIWCPRLRGLTVVVSLNVVGRSDAGMADLAHRGQETLSQAAASPFDRKAGLPGSNPKRRIGSCRNPPQVHAASDWIELPASKSCFRTPGNWKLETLLSRLASRERFIVHLR